MTDVDDPEAETDDSEAETDGSEAGVTESTAGVEDSETGIDDSTAGVDDPKPGVEDSTHDRGESPTPTPQSEALRRQQYYVAVGGGILGGVALMVGFYQRFPDAPVVLPVLAGVFGAGLVLWLAKRSVFPGEGELGDT